MVKNPACLIPWCAGLPHWLRSVLRVPYCALVSCDEPPMLPCECRPHTGHGRA